MNNIFVIHGPNLNLLGGREPEHYGHSTLDQINLSMANHAEATGHSLTFFQSNSESELINQVHLAHKKDCPMIIINPGAFTHTSIALRDAFLATGIPFIEVHLSNIHAREAFRHHSYFSDIANGTITGLGPQGYLAALDAAIQTLKTI